MAEVLILTGPPAAGKTAVADALCERYDRVAHIDVNMVRHFLRAGFVAPWRQGPDWERQHRLAVRNAAVIARNFLAEKIGVIADDVVDAQSLGWYLEELKPAGASVHLVRLMPSLAVCEARNTSRGEGRVRPAWVTEIYERFAKAADFAGSTIDNSDLSVEETADRLLALTTQGKSLVWASAA